MTTGNSCSWSSGPLERCDLGEPVHQLAAPEDIQPPHGPVRTRADVTSNTYWDWVIDHAFLMVPAQAYVGKFLATFKEYPPRQKAASFNMDEVLQKLQESDGSK